MLNMEVDDYIIKSDRYGVTVDKKSRDENGEIKMSKQSEGIAVSTKFIGSYPSLGHALKGIKDNYVLGEATDIRTIDDYRQEIAYITNAFNEQLKLVDKE